MTDTARWDRDDVLRYAFRQGPGRDQVAPLGPPERPLTTSFGSPPAGAATDRLRWLPWGTVDLLEDIGFPQRGAEPAMSVEDRIQHALIIAFGVQRREPSNLFNDHRSCASVRSRFPVHAYLHDDHRAWWLDVYRHGLAPIGDAGWPEEPDLGTTGIALAGRFTHLPSLYGRLRGPLVELELGMSLRSLGMALDLLGLAAHLQLPGPDAGRLMAHLALDPPAEWTAPLNVVFSRSGTCPTDMATTACPAAGPGRSGSDDPTLDEVVAVNRCALDVVAAHPADSSRGALSSIPDTVAPSAVSWAEVLWRRSSGRMPRGLAGFSGRRTKVASTVVTDAVAWLDVAPPTPLLHAVARHITVAACIQDADGFATGWYELDRPGNGPARLEPVRADSTLAARLEACYGHGLRTEVGCAVRHANMVWLLSADVPALVEAVGPGGWTLAQYVAGWMAHGLSVAAAAHGLFARPNRAFDETLLHPVVGIRPGELVLLSVVCGASRFREPMLDLRT